MTPFRSPSRRAVTPQGRGRFAGFDVLAEVGRWDDVTAGVVLSRLDPGSDLSFFSPPEQACAGALMDLLLAQDREPRVPVLILVDRRLALGETDGWFYEDMPDDGEAWRRTLCYLDEDSRNEHGRVFCECARDEQMALLQSIYDSTTWHGLTSSHVWSLWTRYACAAFYSHPWAWNEIGFGGPAYPRGYKALSLGQREGWEVADSSGADPVVWAERVERARRAHESDLGGASS